MKGAVVMARVPILVLLAVISALTFSVRDCNASYVEDARFLTVDGYELAGSYYQGTTGAPSVLLLHQLGSDRGEMQGIAYELQGRGFNVLAYDARGHGQSVMKAGRKVTWKSFGDRDFEDMALDIDAAVWYLEGRTGQRAAKLGIVGASIQSSTGLLYASRHDSVKALVMLSPGLDYRGIGTIGPMGLYSGRPLFMAASRGDERSADAMDRLGFIAGGKAKVFLLDGKAHGVSMFGTYPALPGKVASWLRKNLK